jgi:hypothetical protein
LVTARWSWLALALFAGCESPCELKICDIRQTGCQRAVAQATACTRGVPVVNIPIAVVPRDAFVAAEVERAKQTCEARKRHFAAFNTGLSLLRLAPESYDVDKAAADDASWVGAYYLPGQRTITVIDHGYPLDSTELVATLAHEYAHALQDVAGVFEKFGQRAAPGFDGDLGASAVVEGEAVLVEDLALVNAFGSDRRLVPWQKVFGHWQSWSRSQAAKDASPVLLAPPNFLYPFGSDLVNMAHATGGFAAVDALHATPPRGTRDVLAAVADRTGQVVTTAEDLGDLSAPQLPDGYTVIAHDTYGTWVLERFLERAGAPAEAAGLALRLRADRLTIHRGPTGQIVTTWRLRFADASTANEVHARVVAQAVPHWFSWTADRDLVIAATRDPAVSLTRELAFGPPPTVPTVTCEATASAAPQPFRCPAWPRL